MRLTWVDKIRMTCTRVKYVCLVLLTLKVREAHFSVTYITQSRYQYFGDKFSHKPLVKPF